MADKPEQLPSSPMTVFVKEWEWHELPDVNDGTGLRTHRMRVPGGWLVRSKGHGVLMTVLVPDPPFEVTMAVLEDKPEIDANQPVK